LPRTVGAVGATSIILPPGVAVLLPAAPATLAQYRGVVQTWAASAIAYLKGLAPGIARKLLCDSLIAGEVVDAIVGALGIESAAIITAIAGLVEVAISEIKSAVGC